MMSTEIVNLYWAIAAIVCTAMVCRTIYSCRKLNDGWPAPKLDARQLGLQLGDEMHRVRAEVAKRSAGLEKQLDILQIELESARKLGALEAAARTGALTARRDALEAAGDWGLD